MEHVKIEKKDEKKHMHLDFLLQNTLDGHPLAVYRAQTRAEKAVT